VLLLITGKIMFCVCLRVRAHGGEGGTFAAVAFPAILTRFMVWGLFQGCLAAEDG